MKNESNIPLTPQPEGEFASGETARQKKKAQWVFPLVTVFLFANIIALYVLHFADRGSSSSTVSKVQSEGISASSLSAASKGSAVSFSPDGGLRVGAGTTVYLDVADLNAIDKAIAAIRFAPLGVSKPLYDSNIISYQYGVSPDLKSVVTTFSGNVKDKTIQIAAADVKNTFTGASIKGLATLSDKDLVVLFSVASPDGMSITVYTAPATIADGKVSVQQDNKVLAANSSATNFITRLSDTSFVVVFYEPYSQTSPYSQRVEVGTVTDGKISFSKSVPFGSANTASLSTTVGQPQSVLSAKDRVFTVPWFVDNMAATKDNATFAGAVGLCLTTYSFVEASKAVSEHDLSCQSQYLPAYFVDSAKLSDNQLVLVFADRANKFALTIATVEFSLLTGKPTFRGAYVVRDAAGAYDFGSAFGFYPKPTVRVLSDNRIAVGFLNPANSGKPSVKFFKYSSDLVITEVSPSMPVSNADFSVASADPKALGSIVMDMAPLTSGVVVGYAGNYAGEQRQRVAFVESFGKPLGVVSDAGGSDFKVAMSGTVKVDKLKAGNAYYAATNGKIYASSNITNNEYVIVEGNSIVLSKDALVGVAVSNSKLFVSSQPN